MVKITLDTNCVYELESQECSVSLRSLVDLWKAGKLALQIPEISASERQIGGGHLDDYGTFEARVAGVGLQDATFLSPTAYIDMAYIGHAVIGDDQSEDQEQAIHQILFPNMPFGPDDSGPPESDARDKWRNAKCDVQAMWCHIDSGGQVFVTRDQNFLKTSRRSKLESLGAGKVADPEEALSYVEALLKSASG